MGNFKMDLAMFFYMRDQATDPKLIKALNDTISAQSAKLTNNEVLEIRAKLLTFSNSF